MNKDNVLFTIPVTWKYIDKLIKDDMARRGFLVGSIEREDDYAEVDVSLQEAAELEIAHVTIVEWITGEVTAKSNGDE